MDTLSCSVFTCSQFDIGSSKTSSLLYANKNNEINTIEKRFKNEILDNIPVITSGPLAGYTALHKACWENKLDLVKILIEDSKADVNAVAADGTQPLVIAGLLGHLDIVEILLKADANVDALFGQEIQSKFVKDGIWCNDFGDEITLVIFGIMNFKNDLLRALMKYSDPYLQFKSSSNKTLLMCAFEIDNYHNDMVFRMIKDKEFLNIRDNDGLSAVDYLYHEKKYGEFRYDQKQLSLEMTRCSIVGSLLFCGVDIYSAINDNPATFLLNSAAYRAAYQIVIGALPYYTFIKKSRALYYATLPMTDPEKYIRPHGGIASIQDLDYNREKTIEPILKDLVNRITFGFFVPEEEKKLMDKLIATDTDIKNLVENYKKDFIYGTLKNLIIQYGDNSITYFDFVMKVGPSDKKLRPFAKDEDFVEVFRYELDCDDDNLFWFSSMYLIRIKNIQDRIELIEILKIIPQLRKFIPLPFELMLETIEYLNNDDLGRFIDSFSYN